MKKGYKNPALREEPIGEPALIIAPRNNESIFRWIQSTGRFKSREIVQEYEPIDTNELEELLDEEEDLDSEELE